MIFLLWGSIPVVLLGNALCGLGGGMQATPCSSYYTEVTLYHVTEVECTAQVTSPHLRTPVHCLSGAVHCTGIVIPLLVTRFSVSWRVVSLAGTVPPILALLAISLTPESPAWLVMKVSRVASNKCQTIFDVKV